MPILTQWLDDERKFIIQYFQGPWTIDEYIATLDEIRQMIELDDLPLAFIAKFDRKAHPPSGILKRVKEVYAAMNGPTLPTYIIAPSSIIAVVLDVVRILFPSSGLHSARSIEEVRQIYREKGKN